MEQKLYEDLEDYCTDVERVLLREAAVAYLPLTNANANAYAENVLQEPTKHVIMMHLHLIWMPFYLT